MILINLMPKLEDPPTEDSTKEPLLIPDFGYRNKVKVKGNVLHPTKFNAKLLRMEVLEEELKGVRKKWLRARKLFKEIDWNYGQLICEYQDLDKEVFLNTTGVTKVTAKTEPKKRKVKKEATVKDLLNMTDKASKSEMIELYKKLQAKFGEEK